MSTRPAPSDTISGRSSRGAARWLRDSRLVSLLLFLLIWETIGAAGHINPTVLPLPSSILASLVDNARTFSLGSALGASLLTLLPGYLIAAVIGIPLGIAMGVYRHVRWLWDPYVSILLGTPLVAMIPILVIWFGLGDLTRMVAAFIFAFPLIVLNAQAGVRHVPLSLIEMARSFEVGRARLFWHVLVPGALPSTMLGLRLGISHAVKGVIITEMLVAAPGLGGLIINFAEAYRTDHLLAVVGVSLLLVVLAGQLFKLLEERLTPWVQQSAMRVR